MTIAQRRRNAAVGLKHSSGSLVAWSCLHSQECRKQASRALIQVGLMLWLRLSLEWMAVTNAQTSIIQWHLSPVLGQPFKRMKERMIIVSQLYQADNKLHHHEHGSDILTCEGCSKRFHVFHDLTNQHTPRSAKGHLCTALIRVHAHLPDALPGRQVMIGPTLWDGTDPGCLSPDHSHQHLSGLVGGASSRRPPDHHTVSNLRTQHLFMSTSPAPDSG